MRVLRRRWMERCWWGIPRSTMWREKFWIGGGPIADTPGHYISKGDMAILGKRAEDHLCALEMDAKCLIVCLDSQVSPLITRYATGEGMCDYHHAVRYVYGGQADQSEYTG